MRMTAQQGFTLVEILLVVVIMGMLMAIALPRMNMSTFRVNAGAQALAGSLSYAQRQAISRQADVQVAFDVAQNRIRIHEDADNDRVIDAGERVVYTPLQEGMTFGRGTATARAMGAGAINFINTQGGMPVLTFHRDGTGSEAGGVYLTTIAGLSLNRTEEVRAVEVTRGTGRTSWFSFATGTWKPGQ